MPRAHVATDVVALASLGPQHQDSTRCGPAALEFHWHLRGPRVELDGEDIARRYLVHIKRRLAGPAIDRHPIQDDRDGAQPLPQLALVRELERGLILDRPRPA